MRMTARKFVPLQPGEAPGNPDLGGWRPLPRSAVRSTAAGPDSFPADSLCVSESRAWHPLNLQQAVGLVALRVNAFNLTTALSAVAGLLTTWEATMAA